jgi:hypothetical protein
MTAAEPLAEPDEPALPLTVQTTVPVLTTLLFTLSLAMIGFVGSVEKWPFYTVPLVKTSSKDIALWLFSSSAFLLLFTSIGCVKAHAWDYYSIPSERREEEALPSTQSYKNKCWNYSWLWYKFAIWCYTVGVITLLLGIGILFWPMSKVTSILSLICLLLPLLIKFVDAWFSKTLRRNIKRQRLLKKVLGATYREISDSTEK